ncbi:MAG: hypothetical protein ABJA78_06610 [Ferruginibacter sp.]
MQQRKLNKIISDKLDGMTGIPQDMQVDHAAAWMRLEILLQPVKKKRYSWILFAAASLFIIIACWLIAGHIENKNALPVVKYEKNPSENKLPQTDKMLINPVTDDKSSGTLLHKKYFEQTKKATIEKNDHPFTSPDTVTEILPDNIATVIQPGETIPEKNKTVSIVIQPVKQKLKVMHINEMGNIVIIKEEKNTTNNSSMLLFNKTVSPTESSPLEEDNIQPVRKKSIFKSATGLQDNN